MSETIKKTLLVVTPYFPPDGGGLERYAFEISKRLNESGTWKVVVLTSGLKRGKDIVENIDGMKVIRLSYDLKISNTPFSCFWPGKIRKILKDEKPDLINIHMPVPGIGDVVTRLAKKIPLIVNYHTGSMKKGKIISDIAIYIYEHCFLHRILKRADRIICPSDYVRLNFIGRYLYKSTTITPGVDLSLYKSDLSLKSSEPTILFVAGLGKTEQHKGLKKLLEALKVLKIKIPNIQLVVVGDGNMRTQYEEMTKKLDINRSVTFTGKLGGKDLAKRYQMASVFCLPTNNDSFSMSILEAMASELPVLSFAVGGVPDLVKNDVTGLLLDSNSSSEKISEALFEILSNPERARLFGIAGKENILHKYNWDSRAEMFEKIAGMVLKPIESKQKIGIVTPYYLPKVGGLEIYARQMTQILKENGFDVFVITSNHYGPGWKYEEIEGVRIYRMPILFKLSNTPVHFFWKIWMRKIFKQEKPNLINGHLPVPFIADLAERARGKTKFVLTYHNDLVKSSFIMKIFSKLTYIFFINKTLKRSSAIIVTSNYYAGISPYLKKYQGKIYQVSPIINTDHFSNSVSTKEYKEKFSNYKTILFVGQLDKTHQHKGLRDAMIAVKIIKNSIPNVALVVVGRGDYINTYKSFAKRIGIINNIFFEGFVPDNLLPQYYRGADVLVLPSRDMAEGFGLVILEAASCGTPAVATNVGGIPAAIVNGETGLLVPSFDSEELARCLIKILTDKKYSERLGLTAHNRVLNSFTQEVVSRKYLDIMQAIISDKL